MSDWYHSLSQKLQQLSRKVTSDGKRYIRSAVSKGEELGQKGKIQIEVEKLKWELKQKQSALGKYVADKKISASVTDFSHDSTFLDLVNQVQKLQMYIEDRRNQRESIEKGIDNNA